MNNIYTLLFILFSFVLITCKTPDPPVINDIEQDHIIVGIVIDATTGEPLDNATVYAWDDGPGFDSLILDTTTASDGLFLFSSLRHPAIFIS